VKLVITSTSWLPGALDVVRWHLRISSGMSARPGRPATSIENVKVQQLLHCRAASNTPSNDTPDGDKSRKARKAF